MNQYSRPGRTKHGVFRYIPEYVRPRFIQITAVADGRGGRQILALDERGTVWMSGEWDGEAGWCAYPDDRYAVGGD